MNVVTAIKKTYRTHSKNFPFLPFVFLGTNKVKLPQEFAQVKRKENQFKTDTVHLGIYFQDQEPKAKHFKKWKQCESKPSGKKVPTTL